MRQVENSHSHSYSYSIHDMAFETPPFGFACLTPELFLSCHPPQFLFSLFQRQFFLQWTHISGNVLYSHHLVSNFWLLAIRLSIWPPHSRYCFFMAQLTAFRLLEGRCWWRDHTNAPITVPYTRRSPRFDGCKLCTSVDGPSWRCGHGNVSRPNSESIALTWWLLRSGR